MPQQEKERKKYCLHCGAIYGEVASGKSHLPLAKLEKPDFARIFIPHRVIGSEPSHKLYKGDHSILWGLVWGVGHT
jgi:hypothetical protein